MTTATPWSDAYKALGIGERRLVDWQYHRSSHFVTQLCELLCRADGENFARLAAAFPEEADAIRRYKVEADYWPNLERRLGLGT